MKEKIIEPLKAYRGGEIFDKWCKDNDIVFQTWGDTSEDSIYIVIDNEVCGRLDPTSKIGKALIGNGSVVVSDLPPRYRAPIGEFYWYITSCMYVDRQREDRDYYDNSKYEARNYFASYEEAEEKLHKIKEILK